MSEMSLNEVHSALTDLRAEVEKKSQDLEKIARLNDAIDKQEETNQKLTAELVAHKAKEQEIEEKLVSLEAELSRPNMAAQEQEQKSLEFAAFEKYILSGKSAIGPEEMKYLRTDNNVDGGFLVDSDFRNEIIKKITEVSPVRSVARVIQTSMKEVIFPKRETNVTAAWAGEGASITATNSTYGQEKIPLNKLSAYTDVTFEMLQDAAFNMVSEMNSDIAEDMAEVEGAAFVNGDAVNKPEGILTASGVGETNTGSASALTADSLISIQGELKAGYTQTFMFNRRTLHQHIRLLKDNENQYLFQLGNVETPNMIAGVPYIIANDMPDVAANAFPVVLGDFRKGYYIVDGVNISVLRDDFTQATSGKVRFVFNKRTGGQVVLAEAFQKLKVAA